MGTETAFDVVVSLIGHLPLFLQLLAQLAGLHALAFLAVFLHLHVGKHEHDDEADTVREHADEEPPDSTAAATCCNGSTDAAKHKWDQ